MSSTLTQLLVLPASSLRNRTNLRTSSSVGNLIFPLNGSQDFRSKFSSVWKDKRKSSLRTKVEVPMNEWEYLLRDDHLDDILMRTLHFFWLFTLSWWKLSWSVGVSKMVGAERYFDFFSLPAQLPVVTWLARQGWRVLKIWFQSHFVLCFGNDCPSFLCLYLKLNVETEIQILSGL